MQIVLLADLEYIYDFVYGIRDGHTILHIVGKNTYRSASYDSFAATTTWLDDANFNSERIAQQILEIAQRQTIPTSEIFLVTMRERSVRLVSNVATMTGCKGLSARSATLFRDKLEMAAAAASIDIPIPITQPFSESWAGERFPPHGLMVKPRRGSVSIGLRKIWNNSDLASYFMAIRNPDRYLMQEFIQGPMFFINGVRFSGRTLFACIGKHLTPLGSAGRSPRSFVESWLSSCSATRQSDVIFNQLVEFHDQICGEFGLLDGCTHFEFFLNDGRLIFCEAAARPPGERILCMQRALWGCTTATIFARLLSGASSPLPEPAHPFIGRIDFTPHAPVSSCDSVYKFKYDWILEREEWTPSKVAGGNYTDPLGRILFRGETVEQCESRLRLLKENFTYHCDSK